MTTNHNHLSAQTPLEDLRQAALRHYEEISTAAHVWHSVIPKAINCYFDSQVALRSAPDITGTAKLRPCPRGHTGTQVCNSDERMFYVTCVDHECFWALGEGYDRDAMPDHAFRSEEEAIEAWNTRAAPSDTEQVIRLREALGELVMRLLQKDFEGAREIALTTPVEFSSGSPRAALQPKAELEK